MVVISYLDLSNLGVGCFFNLFFWIEVAVPAPESGIPTGLYIATVALVVGLKLAHEGVTAPFTRFDVRPGVIDKEEILVLSVHLHKFAEFRLQH